MKYSGITTADLCPINHTASPIFFFQPTSIITTTPLDRRLIRNRRNILRLVVLYTDGPGVSGHDRLTLEVDVLAALLGLTSLGCVGLDTGQELVSAARLADVLDADVQALLNVSVADLTEDDDTDGRGGHIVDDTGLAVVELVGHTEGLVNILNVHC